MEKEIKALKYFLAFFILGLTLLFGSSLYLNIQQEFHFLKDFALIEGKASYNKDLLYRRWASMHGGVYVPITDETSPNPILNDIPNRDITTESGEKLTLVNPAYMTRQVHKLAKEQYGVKGHITSLNPIREENKPDEWETKALQRFETGESEYSSIEVVDGERYLRLMHAMDVEQSCLKCHAVQGYQVGDVRGGISVSVPMQRYDNLASFQIKTWVVTYLIIYIIILGFTIFGYKRALKGLVSRHLLDKKLEKLNAELEMKVYHRTAQLEASNKELEAFGYSVSHDLRAPLRHIHRYVELLSRLLSNELPDKARHYLDTISGASSQMGTLIDELLQYSRSGRQEIVKEALDMNWLIREVFEELIIDTKGRVISWDFHQLPKVSGDYVLLKQVWGNLLGNAVKYSRNRKKAEISVGYKEEGNCYVFWVRDNGAGFDMKYAQKLFGVFQRFHSQSEFEGIGIGLANVQRIVHKHLGQVWAEAEAGKGAKFYFSLPKYLNGNCLRASLSNEMIKS